MHTPRSCMTGTSRSAGASTALRRSCRASTTASRSRPTTTPPDYRLSCLFVDRDYRRKGVAAAVVQGALDLIAEAGGGVVEAYPQDTDGKKVSASFLYNGTRTLFEKAGFDYRHGKARTTP